MLQEAERRALCEESPPVYSREDIDKYFTLYEDTFVISKSTDYITLKNAACDHYNIEDRGDFEIFDKCGDYVREVIVANANPVQRTIEKLNDILDTKDPKNKHI